MAQMNKNEIATITIAGIVTLIFGGLLWKSAGAKEEPIVKIQGVTEGDDGYKGIDDDNNNLDEGGLDNITDNNDLRGNYDNVFGGKKSRKRRRNKTRKSRSKSKRSKK